MGRKPGQIGTYNGTPLERVATYSALLDHEEVERGEGSDLGGEGSFSWTGSSFNVLSYSFGVRLLGWKRMFHGILGLTSSERGIEVRSSESLCLSFWDILNYSG